LNAAYVPVIRWPEVVVFTLYGQLPGTPDWRVANSDDPLVVPASEPLSEPAGPFMLQVPDIAPPDCPKVTTVAAVPAYKLLVIVPRHVPATDDDEGDVADDPPHATTIRQAKTTIWRTQPPRSGGDRFDLRGITEAVTIQVVDLRASRETLRNASTSVKGAIALP
jgi:hypothetical protein